MAQRVQVELVDDITGEEAAETVKFGVDGTNYEIDLSTENAKEMRDLLSIYTEKARKVRPARPRSPRANDADKAETQRIRQWAAENGYPISARGRISTEIIERYRAENTNA